jgi:hypothetical protein
MFQYAVGSSVAHRNGLPFLVDTSLFGGQHVRRYELGVFDLSSRQMPSSGFRSCFFRLVCSQRRGIAGAARVGRLVLGIRLILESQPYAVDPALLALGVKGRVCLHGYWQCPGYFADTQGFIRREFTFRSGPTGDAGAVLGRILAANAVSLHIRRGDYLGLYGAPVLPLAYYQRAAQYIAARVVAPSLLCLF